MVAVCLMNRPGNGFSANTRGYNWALLRRACGSCPESCSSSRARCLLMSARMKNTGGASRWPPPRGTPPFFRIASARPRGIGCWMPWPENLRLPEKPMRRDPHDAFRTMRGVRAERTAGLPRSNRGYLLALLRRGPREFNSMSAVVRSLPVRHRGLRLVVESGRLVVIQSGRLRCGSRGDKALRGRRQTVVTEIGVGSTQARGCSGSGRALSVGFLPCLRPRSGGHCGAVQPFSHLGHALSLFQPSAGRRPGDPRGDLVGVHGGDPEPV